MSVDTDVPPARPSTRPRGRRQPPVTVDRAARAAAALLRRRPGRAVPGRRGADRAAFTFTPQLDAHRLRRRAHRRRRPASTPLPLAEQVAAARAAHPDGHARRRSSPATAGRHHAGGVLPAGAGREAAHRVRRPVHRRGPRHADHLVRRDAGDDLAGRPAPQPAPRRASAGTTPNSPRAGCGCSSSAGSSCGGGVARTPREPRRTLAARPGRQKGVRRTRGWHAATGVWLAVGLLFLSATGLTWSRYAGGELRRRAGRARRAHARSWTPPAPAAPAPHRRRAPRWSPPPAAASTRPTVDAVPARSPATPA